MSPGAILVASNEPVIAASLEIVLGNYAKTEGVGSLAAADSLLDRGHWSALACEAHLPDGKHGGIILAQRARRRWSATEVLLLLRPDDPLAETDFLEPGTIIRRKPVHIDDIRDFGLRAAIANETLHTPYTAAVFAAAKQYGLTLAEALTLAAMLGGVARHRLADHFGLTEDGIKTRIRKMNEKTHQNCIGDLATQLRHDALRAARASACTRPSRP